MSGDERGPERPPGVPRRRLHPQVGELPVAQHLPVGHRVQRHAPGETQTGDPGLLPQRPGQPQHHLFDDRLHRGGEIHLPPGERLLRPARRSAEQRLEPPVRHPEPGAVVEEGEIEPETAVPLQVHQVFEDRGGVPGLPVRREPHDLVLAGIHPEPEVVGERRVEEAERVREVDLPLDREFRSPADTHRSGGPLPHPVHGQDHRLRERRGVEGARRVRLVVFGEQESFVPVHRGRRGGESPPQQVFLEQFLLDPYRRCEGEGAEAPGRERQGGLEQPLELQEGFVVEDHPIDFVERRPGLCQTGGDGAGGIPGVVFSPREPLFLGGRDDPAVLDQGRRAVVVERGEPEDSQGAGERGAPVRRACRSSAPRRWSAPAR